VYTSARLGSVVARKRVMVDRDSFKLSFKTVNQAGFQLKESGIRAKNKLKIGSTWL